MLVETLKNRSNAAFCPLPYKLTSGSRAIHDTNLYKVGDRSLDNNAFPVQLTFKRTKTFESPRP